MGRDWDIRPCPMSLPTPGARRRTYERLLRKLLQYKNRPAVVMVNSFIWFNMLG